MAENSRGWLFRKRTVLGGALLAGIGLGVYLGRFEGFGLGRGFLGEEGGKNAQPQTTTGATTVTEIPPVSSNADEPVTVPKVVKVLIDDRQFLVREEGKDVPIEMPQLMALIKKAPGDDDGTRVKIYERMSARVSAEEELKKQLADAGIPDTAIIWVPAAQTR